jgi:hypothetical protein
MKRKTLCRIVGTCEALASGVMCYKCYTLLGNIDYNLFFDNNISIEHKIAAVSYTGLLYLSAPLMVFGVADGVSGIMRGAVGYLGLRFLQRATKSQRFKEEIDSSIKSMRDN